MVTKLIDEIRSTLVQTKPDSDLAGEIAQEYTEAVVQCNARLRETMRLIDQGHVTEALKAADQDPPLLELSGILEFPERPDWVTLCQNLKIDPPPELRLDLVERLDEAYATNLGIEGLMRKVRLLALTRSPLPARITIQKLVCQRDPQNLVWRQDLAALEKARLKQIEAELAEASIQERFEDISALRSELTSPWTIPIPQEIVQRVEAAYATLLNRQRRANAGQVGEELYAAYQSYDEPRGQQALFAWRDAIAPLNLQTSDPLYARYEDAILWAEEIERNEIEQRGFEAAIAELQYAMERGVQLPELDQAEYRVRQFGRAVPPATAERLRLYRSRLEFQRMVWLVGAAFTVVVLATGIIALTWYTLTRMQRGEAALAESAELEKLIVEQNLVAARERVDSLDPNIRDHELVKSRIIQLDEAEKKESKRQADWQTAIETAEAAGLETPDDAALKKAEELARTDEEKERVADLLARVDTKQGELRAERESVFSEQVAEYESKIKELLEPPLVQQTRVQLEALEQEIQRWKSESTRNINGSPAISTSVQQRVDPLFTLIDQGMEEVDRAVERGQIISRVTASIGDSKTFTTRLKELETFLGGPSSNVEMEGTLSETRLWQAYVDWQALVDDPSWSQYPDWNDTQRQAIQTRFQKLLTESPLAELVDPVEDAIEFSQSTAVERTSNPSRLFDRRLFQEVYLVQLRNGGRRYYCVKPIDPAESSVELNYFIDDQLLVGKEQRMSRTLMIDLGLAPQCRLFAEFQPILEAHGERKVSSKKTLVQLIVTLLEFEPYEVEGVQVELDPILRGRILRSLIDELKRIDPAFVTRELAIQEGMVRTLRRQLDEDWLDIRSQEAATARGAVKSEFESLPPTNSIAEELAKLEEMPTAPARPSYRYEWVGWLEKTSEGEYQVRSATPLADGELACLTQGIGVGDARRLEFAPIGESRDGVATLRGRELRFGRPVYLRTTPSDSR